MFIGRKNELDFLNYKYASKNAEFIVLYGRRRIGKTELIKEFCKDKKHIFYLCNEYTDKIQLNNFSKVLSNYLGQKFYGSFNDWETAFNYLGEINGEEKTVVVIDEFPYMAKTNKSIPSIIQGIWDHNLKNKNIMLILSGSSMSFFENELLGYKNPLYGRATGIYKLGPLNYIDCFKFFPHYTTEEKIITYAILGGVPHYLKQFNPELSLENNILQNLLTKGTVLFNEVNNLIHQELREPAVYNSILEALASGKNTYGEILDSSKIEGQKLMVYLKNLIELGIVIKEYPISYSQKEKSNIAKGQYALSDNLFKFYYRYIFPYMSDFEFRPVHLLWNSLIKNDLHNFSSKAYENICIKYLYNQANKGLLPHPYINFGRWWGKITKKDENNKLITKAQEIDILSVDLNKENYIIGECKFRNNKFTLSQFEELKEKMDINPKKITYYLFSLSGFSENLINIATTKFDNIKLIYIDELANE